MMPSINQRSELPGRIVTSPRLRDSAAPLMDYIEGHNVRAVRSTTSPS
jgi:hypothetical protein